MQIQKVDLNNFTITPFKELQEINGVLFPEDVAFRQLLITGPPGSGKSTMIRKLRGWPEEGYIDLSIKNWWSNQALAMRPREIHLGFPCVGYKEALAVFDEQWNVSLTPLELDLDRILLPPKKKHIFSLDWRKRYVFEFLLPPVYVLFKQREMRHKIGTHHVDSEVTIEQVKNQVIIYRMAAFYLHMNGQRVYIRERVDAPPLKINGPENV